MRPEPPAPRKKVGRQPTAALWQRTEEDILRVVHTLALGFALLGGWFAYKHVGGQVGHGVC